MGPEQAQLNVASVKAQVRDEQMSATTPLGRERIESSPVGVIRPVLSASAPPLGVETTLPPMDREEELADQLDEAWLTACRNMIAQSLSPAARNIRPQ